MQRHSVMRIRSNFTDSQDSATFRNYGLPSMPATRFAFPRALCMKSMYFHAQNSVLHRQSSSVVPFSGWPSNIPVQHSTVECWAVAAVSCRPHHSKVAEGHFSSAKQSSNIVYTCSRPLTEGYIHLACRCRDCEWPCNMLQCSCSLRMTQSSHNVVPFTVYPCTTGAGCI